MTLTRRLAAAAIGVVTAAGVSGCGAYGLNSLPLPGVSVGDHTVTIKAEMRDVQNLVPNSYVKSANVNVGVVRGITTDGSMAQVSIELDEGAGLPRDSRVKLAQQSLLGSQYLEITPGEGGSPPLANGDVIGPSQTSEYPSTEKVLSALSAVLNGSGLQQIRTITTELNTALNGSQDDARSLIGNLDTFVGGLDRQRFAITRAIDELDRFSTIVADQSSTLDRGVTALAPALEVVRMQRQDLTTTLGALGDFARTANSVVSASYADLRDTLRQLSPTLNQLAASGAALPQSLDVLGTFPFPVSTINRAIRGDYVNLYLTLDLSAETITQKILPSIPKAAKEYLYTSVQNADPFLGPVRPTVKAPTR